MTAPSWQDFFDVGRYTLQQRRPSLLVQIGDVTDAFIAGCSTMASRLIGYGAGEFLANFLDGAFGDKLTDLARDRGVERDRTVGNRDAEAAAHLLGEFSLEARDERAFGRNPARVDALGKILLLVAVEPGFVDRDHFPAPARPWNRTLSASPA
jgi:hypothetical protein